MALNKMAKEIGIISSKLKLHCYKSRNEYIDSNTSSYAECDEILQNNINRLFNNVNVIISKKHELTNLDYHLKRNCLKSISHKMRNVFEIKSSKYKKIIENKLTNEYNSFLLFISNRLFIFINYNNL